MALRFGTDGVRGRALTELTEQYAAALARAAAEVLGGGRWLIGRDTRESGPALEAAVAAGLVAAGASPESVGVVPTPALAALSVKWNCPAAMITASHNPYHDNGIKIFAAGGAKLTDDVEQAIEAAMGDVTASFSPVVVPAIDGLGHYAEHVVAQFPPAALAGRRLVLDCANGAMSEVAPWVARRLGADVVVLHAEPDGRNINDRCGATAPASLAAAVPAQGADLGLAFDGDGDRVIAVDEQGDVVDGDRMIALGALQLQARGTLLHDTVVVTVMSNLGFHRAMQDRGISVEVTPVGDRYVLEALAAGPYSIGGEQSGHIIYPDAATTGDGLLAGLRLAHHLVVEGASLHCLAAEVMTSYPQVLVNVHVAERHPDVASELADEIAAAEAGLGGDGRVLVRASGTEPLIRVMVEAPTAEQAGAVAEALAATVRGRWS
jgi:phosphoglucosamine mutase